ncbi:hypothetical protein NUW58_g2771 [Xylaria curta]|uniref:Uncharacterized protein n=1 Tax=Xylaria curta TaxID=42375 RepID=A0ACC1PFU2_9PEZI|nr:hypothetical protein NUW58_g2771 [Xylaria curta]
MENTYYHAYMKRHPSQELKSCNGIQNMSNGHQEVESKPIEAVDSLGPGARIASVDESRESHIRKDPYPDLTVTESVKKCGETRRARTSLLIEKDFYTLFEDCVPTDKRLKELLQRWIDRSYLQQRLLYCRPFHIVFEEPGASKPALWSRRLRSEPARLIRRSHDELRDLLHEGKPGGFPSQLLSAWPDNFGQLISDEGQPRHFQWRLSVPRVDDERIMCRHPSADEKQILFKSDVSLRPSDNVLWQIVPNMSSSIIPMRTVAFLENMFAPTHGNFTGFGTIGDWFPVQNTTPVLHSTGNFGRGDWLCVQLNMRACIPDETGYRVRRFRDGWGIFPKGIGFPLRRQAAKIPDMARGTTQFAVEFLQSVSIVLKKRHRPGAPSALNYNIVVWLDYNTEFEGRPERGVLSNKIDLGLGLEDCGAGGEGFLQFLIVLARTIDHWRKCWDSMMDKIDEIISVQLQDTLDKKRWAELMFDDSFQLSEQYFTVLQLLRIFQNWIAETDRGIQSLGEELIQQCELWLSWRQKHAKMDELEWSLDTEILRKNIKKVNNYFDLRVRPLRERIEKKKEEVTSLQDALLNASSLREALKAKSLNLYIGVFTSVTVFFTPLGFVARPCVSCVRRKCVDSCIYERPSGASRTRESPAPAEGDLEPERPSAPYQSRIRHSICEGIQAPKDSGPGSNRSADLREHHALTHERWEEVLQRPMNPNEPSTFAPDDTASRAAGVCFPFPSESELTTSDLLAMLPSAPSCEYLISRFFMFMSQFFPILHGPTFQTEYAAFIRNPSAVDFSWLAVLFMLLSIGLHTLDYDDALPVDIRPNRSPLRDSSIPTRRYREAAMICLSKDQFLTRYRLSTLQALLLIVYEFCHEEGVERGWTLLGIALNISIALHCNAEPAPPGLTCIEIERRRRCWAGLLSLYAYQMVSYPGVNMLFLTNVTGTMPADVNDADISENSISRPSRQPTHMSVMIFKIRLFQLSSRICRHLKGPNKLDEKTRDLFDAEIAEEQRQWDAIFLVNGDDEVPSLLDFSNFAHWSMKFHGHHLYLLIHQPFCRPRSNSNCFRQQSRAKCIASGAALLEMHRRFWELPRLRPLRWTLHGLHSFYAVHGAVALASCLLEEESHISDSLQYRDAFISAVDRIGKLQHRSPICLKAYPILSQLQALLFPDQHKWPNPANSTFLETFDTWVDNLQWLNPNPADWNFLDGILDDNN